MHTELLTKLCNGNLQSFIFAVFAFGVKHTDTYTAPALPNTCRGTLRIVGKNMHPNTNNNKKRHFSHTVSGKNKLSAKKHSNALRKNRIVLKKTVGKIPDGK